MSEATEQSYAPPAPGSEHQRLQPFEGTFKSEVKLWMGPGEPVISTGTMTSTWDINGLFMHQDYVGDPNEGPFPEFKGKGYWGYNTATEKYEGFWIDNASTIMQSESGTCDAEGKTWEMCGEMTCPQSKQQFKKRSVVTLIDNDHNKMETFHTGPDGNEMKTMEINYTRA